MKTLKALIFLFLVLFAVPAFAATLTSPTIPAQAKVEIASGKVRIGDDFHIVLKVQASSSTDTAAQASASTSTLGSYNTTGELATSGGYTRGGPSLSGCAVSLSTQTANFTCSAASWNNTSALTFDYVQIYDATCTTNSCANANQVIAIYPVTSFTSSSSGTFTITLPAGAISLAMRDLLLGSMVASGADAINLPVATLSGTGEI